MSPIIVPPLTIYCDESDTLNYAAATAPGASRVAVATKLRHGGTSAVCESVIHQGDRLVAKGTFTFLQRAR